MSAHRLPKPALPELLARLVHRRAVDLVKVMGEDELDHEATKDEVDAFVALVAACLDYDRAVMAETN